MATDPFEALFVAENIEAIINAPDCISDLMLTRAALEAMGWVMGPTDGGFGRYNCIEPHISEGHRIYGAASEMRADGLALAY